jgi:hypothetical protein
MMSPKKAYDDQKRHASERQIPFEITYSEWLEMWLLSGKWLERGKGYIQYQMCRRNDLGGYSVRNCYIGTVAQNQNDKSIIPDSYVNEIIAMYLNTRLTQYDIAEKFGINQSHVSRIVSGKRRRYARELNE